MLSLLLNVNYRPRHCSRVPGALSPILTSGQGRPPRAGPGQGVFRFRFRRVNRGEYTEASGKPAEAQAGSLGVPTLG